MYSIMICVWNWELEGRSWNSKLCLVISANPDLSESVGMWRMDTPVCWFDLQYILQVKQWQHGSYDQTHRLIHNPRDTVILKSVLSLPTVTSLVVHKLSSLSVHLFICFCVKGWVQLFQLCLAMLHICPYQGHSYDWGLWGHVLCILGGHLSYKCGGSYRIFYDWERKINTYSVKAWNTI